MAQATSITVNDRTTPTAVAHTFAPREIGGNVARFVEAAVVPIGENELSIRWRKSNGKYYFRVMLTAPALVNETVNGVSVPTVPRVALGDVTFRFAETSTEQERSNTVGMFANVLAPGQTVVMDTLVKLQGIW